MEALLREIFKDLLTNIEILLWLWGICQVELTKDWKKWLIALIMWQLEITVVFGAGFEESKSFFIKLLCNMVIIIFLMHGRGIERFIKYWFSFFYLGIIFQPVCLFTEALAAIDGFAWIHNMEEEIRNGLTIGILLVFIWLIQKHKNWIINIRNIQMKYYVVGLFCGFCAEGVHYYIADEIARLNTKSMIFWGTLMNVLYLCIYALGAALAFANILKEQYFRESALKSEYLKMVQQHYNGIAAHMREIRSIKHDMQAHIAVLENFIQKEKWEEAKSYLTEIKRNEELQNRNTINVGNELVNAILEHELQRADSETIVIFEGWLPNKSFISDFDLCVIFSNLLSNAVEECGRLQTKDKVIRIEIKNVLDKLLIQIENPILTPFPLEQLGKYTSKKEKENHGYGICNIRKTVQKYDGEIDFQINNGIFSVRVSFYQES